jgi:hypothetical protein
MNAYQKNATLVVRLVGFGVFLVGLWYLLYLRFIVVTGGVSAYPAARGWGSILGLVLGIVLVVAGRPIGCLLGKGLE